MDQMMSRHGCMQTLAAEPCAVLRKEAAGHRPKGRNRRDGCRRGNNKDDVESVGSEFTEPGETMVKGSRVAKYEVDDEIRVALQKSILMEVDFDGRIRQELHAIHHKVGRQGVHEAIGFVMTYAAKHHERKSVKCWPAFICKLLKKFRVEAFADLSIMSETGSMVSSSFASIEQATGDPGEAGEDTRQGVLVEWATAAVQAGKLIRSLVAPESAERPLPAAPSQRGDDALRMQLAKVSPETHPASAAAPAPQAGPQQVKAAPHSRTAPSAPAYLSPAAGHAVGLLQTAVLCRDARCLPCNGEVFLELLLSAMHADMMVIRRLQQQLVSAVEDACRSALGSRFRMLELVGSTALGIETPGSDVDVVCFTSDSHADEELAHMEAERLATVQRAQDLEALQRVHAALSKFIGRYADMSIVSAGICEARVPILGVLWSFPAGSIAVDLSMNQQRPVDHVRWFQQVAGTQLPVVHKSPPVAASKLVTVVRCIKWWMKQRQIPRFKEGGLPTFVWLLLALHICSSHKDEENSDEGKKIGEERPIVAIVKMLAAFFHHYASAASMNGTLSFRTSPVSSEFKAAPQVDSFPWARLCVMDPATGCEELVQRELPPATQLLIFHELRRASVRMPDASQVASQGCDCRFLKEIFEPVHDNINLLPAYLTEGLGALVLLGDPSSGVGNIEVAIIHYIVPKEGWLAPFLHRTDKSSELHAQLLDVADHGRWGVQRKGTMLLCPCHFVCRAGLSDAGARGRHLLDLETLERLRRMQGYLEELRGPSMPASASPCNKQEHRRERRQTKERARQQRQRLQEVRW